MQEKWPSIIKIFFLYCFALFWPQCTAVWGLSSRPGIEPGPHAFGVWSLIHWTAREVPCLHYFEFRLSQCFKKHVACVTTKKNIPETEVDEKAIGSSTGQSSP